jgi:acetyl-CoA acyltransferase 1
MKKIETIKNEMVSKNRGIFGQAGVKRDDDVVVVCALRTAQTRAKKGLLKDTKPEQLLAYILKGVLDKTQMDPKLV